MKKITGNTWLQKHMSEIETDFINKKKIINAIKSKYPNVYYSCNIWTPLKLIILDYTMKICIPIIKKSYFKKIAYVDLFACSGINKLNDNPQDCFVGSAIIPVLRYCDDINMFYFCEKENTNSTALSERLSLISQNNIFVHKGDYNTIIDTIINEISDNKTYSFFFIDPYAMEFTWDTMKKILDIKSDILLNYMTTNTYRAINKCKLDNKTTALNNFFGDEGWKKCNSASDALALYQNNIKNYRKNALIKTIKVPGKSSFYYHMIFITKKTKNENQWMRGIDKVKEEIENCNIHTARNALDILKGRQLDLDSFM